MKMRDLERLTGVNRETIRVYLREGLLPTPQRPKPNVAEYSPAHVKAILAIRQLQRDRKLTVPQIKRALAGDPNALPADPAAFPHLDTLLAARLGVDDALTPVASLIPRNPRANEDAAALAGIGAVELHHRDGQAQLSRIDAQIVSLWGDMRAAGFTEDRGFAPAVTALYVGAAADLARQEVDNFLSLITSDATEHQAAEMAQSAIALMLPFFGLLRTKAVLAAFEAAVPPVDSGRD
jgi:DNA-binding transcriptional MerR regulator